jgi:hypothetical protein
MSVKTQVAQPMLGGVGVVVGAVLGLIVGADIGGNWFPSASFGGMNGYEFTGFVGAVLGGMLLGVVGVWLAGRRRRG